ncbi:hypothetical protein BD410DRAFT_182752 [Rickenella mellea]|uniref:Uncharacterized protein n=1 Tax=Rickenella mellea TaxID=50990 RepID=A0A4Y7Q663_9AGAM|nr:hypothetical protein BD410DRAFT_182752 [Rickenella mellea]
MGRKGKGPPYLNPPDEKYVVVMNPWGLKTPRMRVQRDADIVGAWMRAVFGFEPGLIERVFMMGVRDEVIIELSSRTDIVRGLGSHRWSEFLEPCPAADAQNVSYIFEYNWRRHGDPGEHSWVEYFPRQDMPPPAFPVKGFPRKYPYPKPHWAEPSNVGSNLSSLILRLPESRVRTPTPPPPEPEPVQAAPSIPQFAPYTPPAHHPSHTLSQFANPELNPATSNDNEDVKPLIKTENQDIPLPPPVIQPEINSEPNEVLGKLGKADPYEEEEAAQMLLKKEDTDPLTIID